MGNKDNGAKETLVSKQKVGKLLFSKKVGLELKCVGVWLKAAPFAWTFRA